MRLRQRLQCLRRCRPTSMVTPLWRQMSAMASGGGWSVTKTSIWLDMADPDRRRAGELHGVGDQDDVPGIGDDGLGGADLAVVEIEQRAVVVDGRDADHGIVDLELAR